MRSLVGGGVADSDDVEDLVQSVRRDVSAISRNQDARQAARRDPRVTAQSEQRPLSRSFSEATWDRPRTGTVEREDEAGRARPAPKAHVRGRYVFSGGAETQVLAGGQLAANQSDYDFHNELASQFSPRPVRDDHYASPRDAPVGSAYGRRRDGSAGRGAPATIGEDVADF